MSVVVRVMGPLEVISQGRPVLISAGKEGGLLVLLALQSGRVVPSERLIEALWDGEPPPSVETSLRVLVSRVRKTMSQAGAGRSIITRSPGYVLDVDEVDVAAFEHCACGVTTNWPTGDSPRHQRRSHRRWRYGAVSDWPRPTPATWRPSRTGSLRSG